MLLLKFTEVTTEHQKLPKTSKNSIEDLSRSPAGAKSKPFSDNKRIDISFRRKKLLLDWLKPIYLTYVILFCLWNQIPKHKCRSNSINISTTSCKISRHIWNSSRAIPCQRSEKKKVNVEKWIFFLWNVKDNKANWWFWPFFGGVFLAKNKKNTQKWLSWKS